LLQKAAQEAEANWVPLSEVTVTGTPKRETQEDRKASTQLRAEMLLRGTASSQRVVLSTMVKMYRNPSSEAGRGPTKSTCTWLNLRRGIGMASTEARGCLVTFARWQATQSLHHEAISARIPGQTKRADTILRVALIPGWATPWIDLKTSNLSASGTKGLHRPVEQSHSRLTPSTSQVRTCREGD
jgi:hypothetical protein